LAQQERAAFQDWRGTDMYQGVVSKVLRGLVWIGLLNFFSFALFSSLIGGDALGGQVHDGHYFVSYKGNLTEVSSAVFTYNYIHSGSQLLTFPLMMIAGVVLGSRKTEHERAIERRIGSDSLFIASMDVAALRKHTKTYGLVVLAIWTSFLVEAMIFGGSIGPFTHGHYYLTSGGRLTEVGAGLYLYMLWHQRLALAAFPAAVLLSFWRAYRYRRRSANTDG